MRFTSTPVRLKIETIFLSAFLMWTVDSFTVMVIGACSFSMALLDISCAHTSPCIEKRNAPIIIISSFFLIGIVFFTLYHHESVCQSILHTFSTANIEFVFQTTKDFSKKITFCSYFFSFNTISFILLRLDLASLWSCLHAY